MTPDLTQGEKPAWNTSNDRPGGDAMDRVNEAAHKATMRKENLPPHAPEPDDEGGAEPDTSARR